MEAALNVERHVVLEGVASGQSLRLATAGRIAGNEVVQTAEAQISAVPVVKEAVHIRPPVLKTELPIVAACVVAHIVKKLPVGIHAAAGNGSIRAQGCEAPYLNLRQAKVLRYCSHIQTA